MAFESLAEPVLLVVRDLLSMLLLISRCLRGMSAIVAVNQVNLAISYSAL